MDSIISFFDSIIFFVVLIVLLLIICWPLLNWILDTLLIKKQNKIDKEVSELDKKYLATEEEFKSVKKYVSENFNTLIIEYRNDISYILGNDAIRFTTPQSYIYFYPNTTIEDILTILVLAKKYKKKRRRVWVNEHNYPYVLRLDKRINELVNIPEAEIKLYWGNKKRVVYDATMGMHYQNGNRIGVYDYDPNLPESNINYWHDELRQKM